jgi:predicted nicotinamide N-methyase
VGYKWGEDFAPVLSKIRCSHSDDEIVMYDVALAAECLWRHDSHEILITALSMAVKQGGIAIITFSHHIPGLEAEDLSFFDKATEKGWRVVDKVAQPVKHMWSDKTVDMFICTIQKL